MFGFKRTKPEVFTDVLDEVSTAAPETETEAIEPIEPVTAAPFPPSQPQDWLLQLLSGLVPPAEAEEKAGFAPPQFESSYFDEDIHLEDAVAPLLEAIASCEQDAIAEELGLHQNLSKTELQKLRRTFARDNHPDRLDPSQRDLATHRMTIANMLIDRELHSKSTMR